MWVFAAGMQRSGSTLQFQILSELIESQGMGRRSEWCDPANHADVLSRIPADYRIFKTHNYTGPVRKVLEGGHGKVFYSYRDIRDVISSLAAKNVTNYAPETISKMTKSILAVDAIWRNIPGACIISYERLLHNLPAAIQEMARHLGVVIDEYAIESLAERYSLSAQRRRISSMEAESLAGGDSNNMFDPHSLLHSNHIESGEIGRYKRNLNAGQIAACEIIASEWLKRNNLA